MINEVSFFIGIKGGNRRNNDRVKTSFQVVLTVAAKALQLKNEGVQVVEWVGLVPFSFQFFTRLAAVFAEEVGDFGAIAKCRHI